MPTPHRYNNSSLAARGRWAERFVSKRGARRGRTFYGALFAYVTSLRSAPSVLRVLTNTPDSSPTSEGAI